MKTRGIGTVPQIIVAAAAALFCVGGPPSILAVPPVSPSLWDNVLAADGIVLARIAPLPPPCLVERRPGGAAETEDVILDVVRMGDAEDVTEDTTADGPEDAGADETQDEAETDDDADADNAPGEEPPTYVIPEHLMVVLRFDVEEIWKGSRLGRFEMRVPVWESDRTGCHPGRTVVAFLSRERGAPIAWNCLYGDRDPGPGALESLHKQIRRAVSIQGKGAAGFGERIDWLVDQVEFAETFREALYELSPAADRELYMTDATLRRPLAPYLTAAQMDRIERSFLRRKPVDASLPGFLFILADRPSRRIDDTAIFAIESAMATPAGPAPQWLKDALGIELERFGDEGRMRALVPPGWCPMPQLRSVWETARRELGIPRARTREPSAGTDTGPASPREG